MYNKILDCNFEQTRAKYAHFESINSVKRVITFDNNAKLDTYSNDSSVVVYFDIIGEGMPLVLIERVKALKVQICKVKEALQKFNNSNKEYSGHVVRDKSKKWLDIIIVKQTLITALEEE